MAKKFLTPIDMTQLEVQNHRLQNLSSAPSSPVIGQVYYDTTSNAAWIWNGTAWAPCDPAKAVSGSIPNAALATNPLARANHTGTQLASTISDLATTVQAYRLNQFAAPNANIAMGGNKFTGLGTPTTAGDSAEYSWVINQVQSAAAGISSKDPVNVVSTTNIATLSGLLTVDGVTLTAGQRVLVTGQTTSTQNGVYTAASGAWSRSTVESSANSQGELDLGATWLVLSGTANAGTQWRLATTGTITVGTTAISIVQFGAAQNITAGNGLTQSGNSFVVNPVASGGITVSASGVAVDTNIVARKFSQTLSTSATSYAVVHSLGTQDVEVQVRQAATPFGAVECDVTMDSTSQVTVAFATAPSANAYRVTVIG